MFYEIISIGLGVAAGASGVIAYIYKRGVGDGIDKACGKRIENKIDAMQSEGDEIHNELKTNIGKVDTELKTINTKLDTMKGSFDTFKELLKR